MNSDGIQGNITDFYSVPYETLRSKAYNSAVWGGIWANILWPCSRIPITLYCLVTTVSPIYSAKVVLQIGFGFMNIFSMQTSYSQVNYEPKIGGIAEMCMT